MSWSVNSMDLFIITVELSQDDTNNQQTTRRRKDEQQGYVRRTHDPGLCCFAMIAPTLSTFPGCWFHRQGICNQQPFSGTVYHISASSTSRC